MGGHTGQYRLTIKKQRVPGLSTLNQPMHCRKLKGVGQEIDVIVCRNNLQYCSWLVDLKVGRPLELAYYSAQSQGLESILEYKRRME
jgi:hypothetical protein